MEWRHGGVNQVPDCKTTSDTKPSHQTDSTKTSQGKINKPETTNSWVDEHPPKNIKSHLHTDTQDPKQGRTTGNGSPYATKPKNPKNKSTQHKLSTRPRWLGSTKITRQMFRTRAYHYNTLPGHLTSQPDLLKFKKALKTYMNTRIL